MSKFTDIARGLNSPNEALTVEASCDDARLLQGMMLVASHVVENVADATGVEPASRAAALVVVLNAVGIATKQDMKLSTGLASRVLRHLTETDRVAVANLLP